MNLDQLIQTYYTNPNGLKQGHYINRVDLQGRRLTVIQCENQHLSSQAAKIIAEIIMSGYCPEGLVLELAHNQMGNEGVQMLAEAMMNEKAPDHIIIDLRSNYISILGIKSLADMLISGKAPNHLSLYLSDNLPSEKEQGIYALAKALCSGKAPSHLTLDLSMMGLNNLAIAHLAYALQSGEVPEGLHLALRMNEFDQQGWQLLLNALSSGYSSKALHLDLSNNIMPIVMVHKIIDTLNSGSCREYLTLDLPALTAEMMLYMNHELKPGQLPFQLNILENGMPILEELLEKSDHYHILQRTKIDNQCVRFTRKMNRAQRNRNVERPAVESLLTSDDSLLETANHGKYLKLYPYKR